MSLLGFGQPLTGVFQMCYLVEDIEASMQRWVEQLNVGPWFLLEHFTGERGPIAASPVTWTWRSRWPTPATCSSS